jgi:hypothetical protein
VIIRKTNMIRMRTRQLRRAATTEESSAKPEKKTSKDSDTGDNSSSAEKCKLPAESVLS